MVKEGETQVKGEMEESVDPESDVRGEKGDDSGDEDDVEDSSRMSEALFQADQLYLRSILPQEIWYMIMDVLNDSPEDLINCVNASPYFWELQRNERVIFLFPALFDILVKLYEPRGWFKVLGDNQDESQDLPGGREENNKKWISAVLNCRLVCTSWNEAIENCYARPDMSGIPDFQTDLDPRSSINLLNCPWMRRKFQITKMRTAEKLIEQFGRSHHSGERAPPKNPILGRRMLFEIGRDRNVGAEAILQSLNTVSKILKMFGKGLWYICIDLAFRFLTDDDQYYLRIREWLCLMPNLKYLQFYRTCSDGTLSPGLAASNPMPKLENIQVIYLSHRCGGPVTNEVVRVNSHVPHLKFWDNRQFDEEIGGVLSNLSAFSTHDSYSSADVKMMEKYGRNWKLNTASVYNCSGNFKGIFQLLENYWTNTLNDLTFNFPHSGSTIILDGFKNLRLNLPHIRRLHLRVEDFLLLDFILPLTDTLEYLEIETWDPTDNAWIGRREKRDAEAKDQTIQFAGFENRMHQSNIWQLFGKLKTIKMEWIGLRKWGRFAVYTRQGEKLDYVHRELLAD